MKAQEMRPVSALIYNLWLFAHHGFDTEYYCPIRAKELPAQEIFARRQSGVCYLEQALPSDPDIKWIELQRGRIFVEVSMVDFGKVNERIEESKFRYPKLSIKGRRFFWGDELVVASRTQQHFGNVDSPRTLIFNSNELADTESLEPFLVIAELICDGGCFVHGLGEVIHRVAQANGVGAGETRQVQALQLLEQQIVAQEQRPLMTQTRRQIAGRAYRSRVLKMSGRELERIVHKAGLELK